MGKLIRLELFNFKSYKGHHTLLFGDSYFTSIIGPNGSGKSNSMDAISFVLGIKSSHLRSSHLRDLVYRGRVLKTSKINDDGSAAVPNGHTNGDSGASDEETQSQKPSRNDPKSAWVMAVYEDDAGDEQRWKRTITNSGTSEYRINDRVVSQQQYTEAMESENILIKARNFLVFQGDVEAIAQQSPKDLTRLIEQISGSLEHKAEYEQLQEEAEKAAEEQNYTLHRRRGINSEIKQYQEQKREAENFQNKADERDQAIVTQILRKLWRFQSTIDESTSAIQEHKENLKEYRRGVEKYEHALNEARGEQSKVNKDVSKVERHIASIEKEIEAKQDNELTVIEGRIEHLTGTSNKSRKKAEGLKKDQDEKVEEINDLKKQLSKVEQAQKHFEAEWKDKLRKQGKQQLSDTDLKEYRTLRAVVATKTSNNQTELDNLLRQKSTDEVTINSLRTKVEGSEAQVQKLQGEVAEITEKRDTTKTVVRELTQEVDAKKKEFNHMQFERVQNNQIWTEAEEKLQEILKQLDEADDGRRRNDKDARAREMVAAMKKLYPGVKGRVGDLCQPKQKKYAEAVIVALGHDFESVIVDTEQTGVACVNYLKEQHFGIMTFVPLDNVKVSTVSSKLKSLPKARLTIDTIDFDSSVERAMSYACSDSIICDDMATARDITYGKNIQVKAVTLDGALIHKNRAMTGGKGPDRGNKRKFNDKDYENLTTLAQRKKDDMKKMPRPSRNSAAEDALQQELASLDQRLAFAKGQLADFERNLASKKKEMDHEKKSLNELKPRYEAKLSSLEALEEKVDEFEASVAKVQDQVFADFCKKTCYDNIRVYEDQQGNLEHEASEKRSNFNTHKQKLQTQTNWVDREMKLLADRIKNLQQEVKNWEKEMEGFEAEKETCESEIDQLRAQVTEAEDRKHKLKEKLAARTEKVNTARNEVAKRSKEIDSRTKAITALEGELYRSCSQRHGLLRHCKLNQINIPLAEGSRKLDTLPEDGTVQTDPNAMDVDEGEEGDEATEAATDYGILIDFDELDEDFKNPDDEEIEAHLEEKVHSLNSELEKLNPNMRAIDRLEGVEARYEVAEKDFETARKSAKTSRDKFNKIKEKRFDLFNKAFTHISEQIEETYKELTRSKSLPLGGKAYLDIEDSDAPYLSGIKYHAMPPLKRFRDMEHLSGGEKTMAALALLFAVHSYQPSPFFVLDEVDAALDNANVEKIREYITKHAGPGMQFIVISLKTGLFQGSESLVGVFRDQECNSSETLTLDLRKYV